MGIVVSYREIGAYMRVISCELDSWEWPRITELRRAAGGGYCFCGIFCFGSSQEWAGTMRIWT